jgi:hypothetical protein
VTVSIVGRDGAAGAGGLTYRVVYDRAHAAGTFRRKPRCLLLLDRANTPPERDALNRGGELSASAPSRRAIP